MKKRVYLCILAACIALSATACGKKQDTPTISTESTSKVESNKSTEETSETETESTETETVATETETTEATETETVSTEETVATETETTETETSETTSTETEVGYKVTDINPAKTMYAKQPLNTRKGPGLSYDKVSVLKKHEAVTVNGIAEEENWYRLDNGSFVSGKYLLDKLPEEKPVETTKPSESPKPEETKPSESTPAPEEPKHEENNTPSEEPKQDEPAPAPTPAPSEPETKPSEPTSAPEPTPSAPSEPEVKPSEPTPEPEPTPSEPEKVCEHKNTHMEYNYASDREATCNFDGCGELVCNDCGVEVDRFIIPPTGNHDYNVTVNQEADCNNEGWETWRCKKCGHWEEYTYPIIPDKHDGYDVFEEDGIKYCSGCYEALD